MRRPKPKAVPKAKTVPVEEVASKLRESMALHFQSKSMRSQPVPGKKYAIDLLRKAAELRQEAHLLDPRHTSSAWAEEQDKTPEGHDTHQSLMAFYMDKGLL